MVSLLQNTAEERIAVLEKQIDDAKKLAEQKKAAEEKKDPVVGKIDKSTHREGGKKTNAVKILTTLGLIAGAVATVAGVVAFVASFLFATLATLPILITAAQIIACACLVAGPVMLLPSAIVKIIALFESVKSALKGSEHLKAQKQIQQQLGHQLDKFRANLQEQLRAQVDFQAQITNLQTAFVRDVLQPRNVINRGAPEVVPERPVVAQEPVVVAQPRQEDPPVGEQDGGVDEARQ